jgi:hypothetical protein
MSRRPGLLIRLEEGMMRRLTIPVLAVAILAGAVAAAWAQGGATPNTLRLADGAPRPAARVADLAWLSGRWVGEGLGGQAEETWSEPLAGAMVGYFRLVKDGKPVFYEIMTLLEDQGSVEMRLKHVNPDMTGWEEKNDFVTFRLVRHEGTSAFFNGLTFRRQGDSLEIFLALRSGETVREEKFVLRRAAFR